MYFSFQENQLNNLKVTWFFIYKQISSLKIGYVSYLCGFCISSVLRNMVMYALASRITTCDNYSETVRSTLE